jgi:hypothetical protein
MRRIGVSSAVLLCCVALITPRLGAQSTQPVQPPPGFPAVGAQPTLSVTSTGAEPRKVLRYVVASGHREHLTMDMAMAMSIAVDGQPIPGLKVPALRIGADLEVTDVSNNGDMTVSWTFTDVRWIGAPDDDPSMVTRLNSMTASVKGLTGTNVVSNRGIPGDLKMDTSKISDPRLSQAISQMQQELRHLYLPLPEEPLGVGSTWEIRSGMNANGMQLFNRASVQLTAIDDTSCALEAEVEITAPPQTISNPAMGGATATLDATKGSGAGTTRIQFDTLSPTGKSNVTINGAMSVDVQGTVHHMNIAVTAKSTIAPGIVK